MRTVFAFPTAPRHAIIELLDQMMPPRWQGRWTDGNLFVGLEDERDDGLFGEGDGWEPEEVRLVDEALGRHPTWAVVADVSGRIDGTDEVRAFLAQVIEDGGVALDDYSNHCWTLREIQDDVRIGGLGFFDFRASYEASRPRRQ
jgi:hypothetical protein